MIIRTGRRIPGAVGPVSGVHYPISVVRMAVGDAYGAEERREGEEGSLDEVALRTERITRDVCRAVAEFAFRSAERSGARVYGGPKWTVSPVYEGMLKEELDAAAARHRDVDYQPVLIDATYAGLLSGAADAPLVIPALNRDGDCLSDLVMPMFGSIAGAESILLAFDADFGVQVAMAEAPHGTAPSLQGKDLANPMAMILACAAVLAQAGAKGYPGADSVSRAIYESTLETTAGGVKTFDLGGAATTTEFTDAVVEKVRTKIEIWSSLLSRSGVLGASAPAHVEPALQREDQRAGDEDRRDVYEQLGHAAPPALPVAVGGGEPDVRGRRDGGDGDRARRSARPTSPCSS